MCAASCHVDVVPAEEWLDESTIMQHRSIKFIENTYEIHILRFQRAREMTIEADTKWGIRTHFDDEGNIVDSNELVDISRISWWLMFFEFVN
jgi:hypothetical protein